MFFNINYQFLDPRRLNQIGFVINSLIKFYGLVSIVQGAESPFDRLQADLNHTVYNFKVNSICDPQINPEWAKQLYYAGNFSLWFSPCALVEAGYYLVRSNVDDQGVVYKFLFRGIDFLWRDGVFFTNNEGKTMPSSDKLLIKLKYYLPEICQYSLPEGSIHHYRSGENISALNNYPPADSPFEEVHHRLVPLTNMWNRVSLYRQENAVENIAFENCFKESLNSTLHNFKERGLVAIKKIYVQRGYSEDETLDSIAFKELRYNPVIIGIALSLIALSIYGLYDYCRHRNYARNTDRLIVQKNCKELTDLKYEGAIPENFFCPISKVIMDDPVSTKDGKFVFNRADIQKWLSIRKINPCNNLPLLPSELVPISGLKKEIDDFMQRVRENASKNAALKVKRA